MDLKVENISDKEYRLMQEIEKLKHIIDTSKVEKQQLISFLEDKIKEYKLCFPEVVKALQEVLDFINKGGKE